jgi:predicted dehydrogenase
MSKKRYAIVGTSGRSGMFIRSIYKDHAEFAELVGLCDLSQKRMDHWNWVIRDDLKGHDVPTYLAMDFERMIKETKPDAVIVVTTDAVHHDYIIRAMEAGCDAITEKPMTIDDSKTDAIIKTVDRTGKNLRVTFNYRFSPGWTKLWELLREGVIGVPKAVEFQWMLDTRHGADYFRRWHREKKNSGGLLVHKATHHFDLVNWLIQAYPKQVFAMGDLLFYGKKNAEARGEKYSYDRYTGSPEAENDPFALFLDRDRWTNKPTPVNKPNMRSLYQAAEADSGYIRDQNVFGEGIDIEDFMSISAKYQNGVLLNYSLVAFSPWEGYRMAITGTKGRIEHFAEERSHIIEGQSNTALAAEQIVKRKHLMVHPMFQKPYEVEIPHASGGHGGGDERVLERIFVPNLPADPFGRDASHIDGAAAVLLGDAANKSIASGLPVKIEKAYLRGTGKPAIST